MYSLDRTRARGAHSSESSDLSASASVIDRLQGFPLALISISAVRMRAYRRSYICNAIPKYIRMSNDCELCLLC